MIACPARGGSAFVNSTDVGGIARRSPLRIPGGHSVGIELLVAFPPATVDFHDFANSRLGEGFLDQNGMLPLPSGIRVPAAFRRWYERNLRVTL